MSVTVQGFLSEVPSVVLPVCSININGPQGPSGPEFPPGQNRQIIDSAQSGSKMGFSLHWLEVAPKWVQSGFRGRFCEQKGPEPTLDPLTWATSSQ